MPMSPLECAKLLDAAMRSSGPAAFLHGMQSAFALADRHGDALVAASLRALLRAGEVETLMRMRAEWLGRVAVDWSRPDRVV